MKSFLTKGKRPIVKWGMLPDGTYFEGTVPEGFSLAVSPSKGTVIIDVDRHGKIDGFDNIPESLNFELSQTLSYPTKNNGVHYWFDYTGTKPLGNKTSGVGIDLRTNKGYVIWYPKGDVRHYMLAVKPSSKEMNTWLEKLFSYVD
jgi:hypothetical protein